MQTKTKRSIISVILTTLISVFLVAGVVFAVTTISTNIVTEGNLQVNGNVTLGDAYADTITLNGKLTVTAAGTQRAIDIQVTPTTADRQLYMVIDYGADAKEAAYIIAKSAKTTDTVTAVRGRAETKAAGAATGEARGIHGQGIAYDNLYAGTVTAVQAEAIAKTGSTVTTVRGAMLTADSEGTPTAITNMYGTYIRVKTSVTPSGDYYGLVIENEKFGSGVPSDAAILVKDTTWSASEISHTAGIVFNTTGKITTGINFSAPVTTGIKFDNAGTQRAIDIQVTPTTADRQLYMVIDYGADAKEAAYIIAKSAKTTDTVTAVRGRAETKAAGAATGEARGIHGQGIAYDNLYAGTVTAVQAEAIAKTGSTVTTVRGAMLTADSEGTPTAITNMYGTYIRVKTSVTPSGDYYGLVIENEAFGGAPPASLADAAIRIKDTSFGASDVAYTYGIDMNSAHVGTADIRLSSGTTIATGATNPTAACVLGSLFLNTTTAKLYICTVVTPTWTVVGAQIAD